MTIEHHLLSGAALHNSKILTFTGDPAAYVPPEAGILVCCLTSPNVGKLYRTTGTTAGAVSLLATGQDGAAATVSVGDVTTGAAGSPAVVTNSGTANAAILDFELPTGPQGDPGPAGPTGAAGADGAAATIAVGTVSTGAAGSSATVANSGTTSAAVFDFAIPQGIQGEVGPAGADGNDGQPGLGIRYSFSATTTTPPASGELRFNNASYASVTAIYAHETARTGVDASSILGSLSAGSVLMLFDEVSDAAYAFYELVSSADEGTYRTLTVTHLGSVGTLGANVSMGFSVAGVQGPTGATGSVSSASTINLTEQGSTPTTPAAGTWELYAKAAGIYALDDAGAETLLGASAIAWGDVTGTLADQTDLQAALDAKAPLNPNINAQTGTTYTLALGDAHGLVTMDNAAANTLTIPTEASVAFPTNTVIEPWQIGAGTTTITAASGVTLNGVDGGSVALGAAYAPATLRKIGTDAWIIAVGGAANVA